MDKEPVIEWISAKLIRYEKKQQTMNKQLTFGKFFSKNRITYIHFGLTNVSLDILYANCFNCIMRMITLRVIILEKWYQLAT